jgi:hypothetical protein
MNSIFRYIKTFYFREFNLIYLLLIAAVLAVLLYFNYWHGLEKKYVTNNKTWLTKITGNYLLYFIPFAIAFFLQPIFYKGCTYYSKIWFWAILLVAPLLFSFRVNFNFHKAFVLAVVPTEEKQFYLYCINWVVRALVLIIPVCFIWWLKDKSNQPLYGIVPLKNIQPYLIMLAVMIPLIALASVQKDFLQVYPKAKLLQGIPVKSFVDKWRYLFFELCYAIDFVSIEFFFRGFLVLSLLQICGTKSIIPIACFYCSIHLGKPMGEAISSFLGAILLGVVVLNTGSIFGGLLVHIGIAFLMEVGGWLGNLK